MGAFFGAALLFMISQNLFEISHLTAVESYLASLGSNDNLNVLGTTEQDAPTPTPTLTQEQLHDTKKEEYITSHMEKMSIAEKVGQMFIWKVSGTELSEEEQDVIEETHAGGVIIMGDQTSKSLTGIAESVQGVQEKVPAFIAIDQEGGVVKRLGEDDNPGAPDLGTKPLDELCEVTTATADLLSKNGVNMNFGTVADIGWEKGSFIEDRTFGDSVENVTERVGKAVSCTQSVLSTVKHFPGHGRTKLDTHKTVPEIDISYDEWKETDAVPFQKGIAQGADLIMVGHLAYTDIASGPASLEQIYIKELRDGMGFEGLIITDDLGMLESSGYDPYKTLEHALWTGMDMLLYVRTEENPLDLYAHALDYVIANKEIEQRIDIHVRRILGMKYKIQNELR